MCKKILKLSVRKKIVVVLSLGFVVFLGWLINDEPPNFFPLNDTEAEYRITKNCPDGQGLVLEQEEMGFNHNAFCIEYKGSNVLWSKKNSGSEVYRITVGKSNIDLEPYLGKLIKNIKGVYTNSDKQCIKDKCTDLGQTYVVINIEKFQ